MISNEQAKNNNKDKHEPKYRRKPTNATIIHVQNRRKQVAQLLQENLTETEIARMLHEDLSVISRDVKALKEQAIQFVYDLAKEDLAFFYRQTIEDIDHVRGECWKLYHTTAEDDVSLFSGNTKKVTTKDRLQALRTILQADIARFELLSRGEVVMSVKSLNERLRNDQKEKRN